MERTALISGATKGIGRATADLLVEQGWTVIGVARHRDSTFPGRVVELDLADRAATARVIDQVCGEVRIDAVVNNVGVVRPALLGEVAWSALDEVYDLNVRTATQLVQAALPGMREGGWGRIVNVSSLVALGGVQRTAYAAAKAALVAAGKTWALELAASGITVNSVAPGPTETELFRENNPPGSAGEQRYLSAVPMLRFGQPAEIGALIAFLLSEQAAFLTGQHIFVDGGASIGRTGV